MFGAKQQVPYGGKATKASEDVRSTSGRITATYVSISWEGKAMQILTIIVMLFAGITAASARIIGWSCGEIDISLDKQAVHQHELVFSGPLIVWSPTGKRLTAVHLEWVGKDGAILNGKRCKTLPYDPKWDEEK
jgi:hypothetical protein